MKINRAPGRFFHRLSILLGITLFFACPFQALADEAYRFERMWPTLQQPWYFSDPCGVAIDPNGFMYVADTYNNRIQKFTSDGQFVGKWGKNGDGDGEFYNPHGVAVDGNGYLYVADTENHRIQKFTTDGQFVGKWGSWGAGNGEFQGPRGIAVDGSGNLYVADYDNHRIQKWTSSGHYVTSWGSAGTDNGEFSYPSGVAVDSSGNMYVADTHNHRIQKFSAAGQFVALWGSEGNSNAQFFYPSGLAVDGNGTIYVADTHNNRIQKFDPGGQFLISWGTEGSEDGEFSAPSGIAAHGNGSIVVADTYNDRIQKFTHQGQFLDSAGSQGSGEGQFDRPSGIAMDSSGNVYVVDAWNNRVQKFSSDGQFVVEWGQYGSENGAFDRPADITIDATGSLYVTDAWNHRVQKFTATGQYLASWGTEGSGDGEFDGPSGIAVDANGNIYVVDTYNYRIQKFTSSGQFVGAWGSEGNNEGEFIFDLDEGLPSLAADSAGYMYVADPGNNRIQKFTSAGQFVVAWGTEGTNQGEFDRPSGMVIDGNGSIYVTDSWNHRVQQFTTEGQFVAAWGSFGSEPGTLNDPLDLVLNDTLGRIYISDSANHRIQLFSKNVSPPPGQNEDKAIIVAGGGPFAGNNIWDATSMLANFAYRTLTYQGYSKDTIYYLSSDTDLDLDGNGILDDVDANATNSNFQSAITSWAHDAENLFIYVTDHGGNGTFRMSESELLQATTLDPWLDTIQGTIPGEVVVVYDACRSGSFVDKLTPPPGKERVIVTSTSADEEAIFCNQGSVSFSFFFWGRMFNGDSFYDSFVNAKNSLGVTYNQNPLLEGNGNGIGNERADQDAARAITVGNQTRTGGDIPTIGSVSGAQTLDEETSALIFAANVIDADGISRVWAVITPPNYSPSSPDNPVTNLPTLNLGSAGNNRYEATYSNFTETGTYNIAIYAADAQGIISFPVRTTVLKESSGESEPIPLNVSNFSIDLNEPPAVQTPVTITFAAQGESATLHYRYWQASGYQTQHYGNWQRLRDWTTDHTLVWVPYEDDHYIIVAHLTDDTASNSFHQAGLSIETSGNSANPIQVTAFTTTMEYPQSSGVAIDLITTATGGSGQLYYRYYYRALPAGQWTQISGYDTSNAGVWTPPGDGLYVVVVHVTDDTSGNTFSTAGLTCTIGD